MAVYYEPDRLDFDVVGDEDFEDDDHELWAITFGEPTVST